MKPFVMLLTGISGSGKTTIANKAASIISQKYGAVQVIDGDETRELIGDIFGHNKEDRIKMSFVNQTIGHYLVQNNISVIYALVCPFEIIRERFRKYFKDSYIEIFVSASYKTCAMRDVKGLYRAGLEGEVSHINGLNDKFERPENCDVIIDTENKTVDESVDILIQSLKKYQFI